MNTTLHVVAIVACVAVALAVVASIGFGWFYVLKNKPWTTRENPVAHEEFSTKLNELGERLTQVQARLEEIERCRTPFADWSTEPASINLTRRGQVLRLHRRGESPGQIASALGLSQGEVQLTIKVQEMKRLSAKTEKTQEQPLNVPGIFDTKYTESRTGGRQIW